MIDDEGIRRLLWERTHRFDEKGALGKFAREAGVSPAFVCAVIAGKYRPTDKILAAIGMQRVVFYAPVASDTHAREAA